MAKLLDMYKWNNVWYTKVDTETNQGILKIRSNKKLNKADVSKMEFSDIKPEIVEDKKSIKEFTIDELIIEAVKREPKESIILRIGSKGDGGKSLDTKREI